jgi:hypothetical protein
MSKELKSKLTGLVHIVSDEEYQMILNSPISMKRFTVTDVKSLKSFIPIQKEQPIEVKKIIKKIKNEG